MTGANFAGAIVRGAYFYTNPGFSRQQLYSTKSYQTFDLACIHLFYTMSDWAFAATAVAAAKGSPAGTCPRARLARADSRFGRMSLASL